jgi:pimeloyl-ACP methyl ester carboxylesterase
MAVTRRTVLAAAASVTAALSVRAGSASAAVVHDPLGGEWDAEGAVERGGGRIHYFERGSGEPLVLLSKLGGWAADWRGVAPLLSTHRRVIAIDPPGHGGSIMLGPAPYVQSVAESAALVRAALEELRIERFSLVGNSLGGCISVLLSSLWPEAVQNLVLLSVSLAGKQTREWLRAQDAEARKTNYDADDVPVMRSAAQVARFGSSDPAVIEEHNRSRALAGRWVRASERGVALAGIADYLPAITARTLLIYGEHGNYREFQSVGEARIRSVRTRIIADSGAFTQQERPVETAAAINAFLDSPSA